MLFSKLLLPTLKDAPQEAEVISHKLMLRAGMIRRVASGIYTWLPLGLKVLRKIETIVRLSLIHISEPTRLRRISYAVFCLKKKNKLIEYLSNHT